MKNEHAYASITAFDKETGEVRKNDMMGSYSDATHYLHNVSIHNVTKIEQKTRHIKRAESDGGDFKVKSFYIHTAEGDIIEIKAFS